MDGVGSAPRLLELIERCNSFLGNGGFFNPGMTASANEDATRDLILDVRDELSALVREQEPQPCEACGGSGTVPIGEHHVTHDMAMDAGEPAMEGMSCGIEYGPCDVCNGSGAAALVRETPQQATVPQAECHLHQRQFHNACAW